MSGNLILISTALENGEKITPPRSQKNDQSKSLSINDYIVIDFLVSGNNYTQNPCLQANAVNASLYNSLVMNAGGAS
ncbi:MAG: hypothetical protein HWQ41_00430 [Nostoc sp. NOS(2021)]|uniref:hypothetical protein n=1 Tax=Nostoc sp. NOS(2021) TaxID=2815407 RepID=UPI0025D613FD|nr:hypothetical protein [Nostoc sp. NOS(2021)]MBN3893810.1 hypothetical protein [Nostoc sp. NOS(2021)]